MNMHVDQFKKQIVHIATMLVVSDIERSANFYTQKFGFTIKEQQDGIILLESGTMLLYLIPKSLPTTDKPTVTLALTNGPDTTSVNIVFRVKNCQKAYEALREKGITFLTPPQSPSWGGYRCFTKDPDGYLIEIEEP